MIFPERLCLICLIMNFPIIREQLRAVQLQTIVMAALRSHPTLYDENCTQYVNVYLRF